MASFTKATKGTFAKTTSAVTGLFKGDSDEPIVAQDDPLSLGGSPETIDPKVHIANGQLWESTGKPEKAVESYKRALAIDPDNAKALSNLARLNYGQSNYSAAAELFQQALAQTPNDAQLYNELGLTLYKLGRTDMAVTVMKRALTLSPGNSRFANNLASVLHESGDVDGAYEVLAKNNKPAVAHFNMAYLQFKAGNKTDARMHLSETMKFESAAGGDPAVSRAVSRGRDMLAQLGTNLPAGTSPTTSPQTTPAIAPPAIVGGPEARTAAAAQTQAGSLATTTKYGWPGTQTPQTAVAAIASLPPAPNSMPDAAMASSKATEQMPAWLKEATESKANESARKPTRVAENPSGFSLPDSIVR